jgi:hypothetical protein
LGGVTSGRDSSTSPSGSPTFEETVDDFLLDGFPAVEQFLTAIYQQYELDPILEAILFGMIGKYLKTLQQMREENMPIDEAHGFAVNEIMADPRVDRLVEEYTTGSTQFFVMKQFGVEVE